MTPRRAPLTAPFRWLIDAVDVGRHQPQVVIAAVVAVVLVGMLPSLPAQLMALAGSAPGMATHLVLQGVSALFGLLVMPVLYAGVYRILDGAERGRPVHVAQIAQGFSDGSFGRIVGVAFLGLLLAVALVVAMGVVMAITVGLEEMKALQAWLQQVVALSEQHAGNPPPAAIQALGIPAGLGAILGVVLAFLPAWILVSLGSAWGLVSVALLGRGAVEAFAAGLRAAFANALPILAMVVALLLPALLLLGVVGIVLGLIVMLAGLLGQAVMGVVTLAVTVLLSVVFTAVFLGFVLNGWRATVSDDDASPPPGAEPVAGFEA